MANVVSVHASGTHTLRKTPQLLIRLVAGLGVAGDAHMGETVQHRFDKSRNPTARNLRQVHLIHSELHDELKTAGFQVTPGLMGENITTRGIDLLALPERSRLYIGREAIIEVTGLRNPCTQLDKLQPGLMQATLARDQNGDVVRKAGVMAIVIVGGDVQAGDAIRVERPPEPTRPLRPV